MIIPYFWAEFRLQNKIKSKQVTVKRWGWSDISQEEAQAMAESRVREAMQRILSGEKLRRRESMDPYGNEDGLPIREEVISRYGNVTITRNSYGSLCLNTPNILFADVDSQWTGALYIRPLWCLFIVVVGIIMGVWQKSFMIGISIAIGVPWLWSFLNSQINQRRRPLAEAKAKEENLTAIRDFSSRYPEWHLRVYETPAGFRILAMHDVFEPRGEIAKTALSELDSDKRFARLCRLQACFRARVSPKYWRTGYKPKESLPKSKWPFPPEHLTRRKDWVEGYDAIASKFASCRFLEGLGSNTIHPDAEAVRLLHDRYSQSDSRLPLA